MLNALTYVFSNELRRPLVWQTVSSIPPVIKEEPFRAKPDQSRFRIIVHVPISIRRGPTGRRCQKGHTRAHDRECTRSSFDTQTRSLESKHLRRMKTKKKVKQSQKESRKKVRVLQKVVETLMPSKRKDKLLLAVGHIAATWCQALHRRDYNPFLS